MSHWRSFLTAALAALTLLTGCGDSSTSSSESTKKSDAPATPTPEPGVPTIELVFTYGSEKEKWIEEETKRFNALKQTIEDGRRIFVTAIAMGSGDCVNEILEGRRETHLTSPASLAYIELGNAESKAKTGRPLVGKTENLVYSPVIIAMWKPMAEALGWPDTPIGWSTILEMAQAPDGWASKGHPEWGKFKFGHTNPASSNSGLISIFAEVYAATGKQRGLTLADVEEPKVAEFVAGIEKSVVHYGSSTGFFGRKMFANGPGYLSAAVLYENMVVESYEHDLPFPIVAIYPKEGTFWSDHPAGIVDRDYVTEGHKEAARKYIDYLLADEQQAETIPFGFRPASVDVPLGPPIDAAHGVDPKEPQTTLEVPSVEVMDAILRLWDENKKHSHVVLALDVSGSMNQENRIANAKDGAGQLVEVLGEKDEYGLITFNNEVARVMPTEPLQGRKEQVQGRIQALFAQGGTAMYDAIAKAYDEALEHQQQSPDLIHAVVVLTDGEDTNSQISLDQLLEKIQFDNETKTVRVFTIGYGAGANKEVLESIADATQAKSYEGTPDNIRKVFREIAMFF